MSIQYFNEVRLDPVFDEDLHLFFEWRNDYRVWKTCRQNDLLTKEQHGSYWKRVGASEHDRMYCIKTCRERATKAGETWIRVGVCGLTAIDWVNRHAEFSLYIAPQYRGHGLASDALKTLVIHGFRNLAMHKIWGEVFETNDAAMHCFKSIGFIEEGRLQGHYYRDGNFIAAIRIAIFKINNPAYLELYAKF